MPEPSLQTCQFYYAKLQVAISLAWDFAVLTLIPKKTERFVVIENRDGEGAGTQGITKKAFLSFAKKKIKETQFRSLILF